MARSEKNPSKKLQAAARREFLLPKSGLLSSSPRILTSRPSSVVPATSSFYDRPKTGLERQYEQKVKQYLPVSTGSEFSVLSDNPGRENKDGTLDTGTNETGTEGNGTKGSSHESGNECGINETIESRADIEESEPDTRRAGAEGESGSNECSSSLVPDEQSHLDPSTFHTSMCLHMADVYLHAAHSNVLQANDIPGTKAYFTNIRLGLKSLLFLISKQVDPALEASVCYKIAQIYFSETENIELADKYVHRAMSLARRHQLPDIRICSELLYAQILHQSNPLLLAPFLLERHSQYLAQGARGVADLFSLARVDSLVVSDPNAAQLALHWLCGSETSSQVRILALLLQVNLHLYRGSPETCGSLLETVFSLIEESPPQVIAMAHLFRLAYLCHTDQNASAYVEVVSRFVSQQRKAQWDGWADDGFITLNLLAFSLQVPYRIQWMNLDEFVVMFYFLSGLLFLADPALAKKALKVFSACLEIINTQFEELTQAKPSVRRFPLRLLTGKIVRLNYIRFSVYYYKVWLGFVLKNDFSGISFLHGFIRDFNNDNFSTEELCYYKLLIPRILYLAAIYYHAHGDIAAAKYYFLRVKHLTSSAHHEPWQPETSVLQKYLGIGCEAISALDSHNEYNVFSTLHLLLISEYEIHTTTDNAAQIRGFLAQLYSDLAAANSDRTFTGSSPVYLLTYKAVISTYQNRGFPLGQDRRNDSLGGDILELFKKVPKSGFLASFISYVLFRLSHNVNDRKRLFTECYKATSGKDDNSKILRLLLAQEERRSRSEIGDRDRIEQIDTKIEKLSHNIHSRLEFARFSQTH